ncbi:MAG: MoaD/ThiS family protein [Lentisphaeria bacterium]|nr:MoaD/ThiS family protein [Lentisphaeria bacterium]
MKVRIEYVAQMRNAAGVGGECFELASGSVVRQLMQDVADSHPDRLAELLFAEDGSFRPSALLFLGDEQVDIEEKRPLTDGCTVTLLAPLAGG